MMTREEYERRKLRLETQLEEGIELLRAGFRQQIRALGMVWMTTAAESPMKRQSRSSRQAEGAPHRLARKSQSACGNLRSDGVKA